MNRLAHGLSTALVLLTACQARAADDDRLLRQFAPGADANAVGLIDPAEDTDTEGPQAIAAGDDGQLYLLDQLNGRVLRFDPTDAAKAPQSLALPDSIDPTDIVVSGGALYAWDGQVRVLQPTGPADAPTRGLALTRSAGPVDDAVTDAFAQMGSQPLDGDGLTRRLGDPAAGAGRGRQTVASHGRGALTADFAMGADGAAVDINLRPKGAAAPVTRLKLQVRSKLGAVEVLDVDRQGRAFVLAENIPTDFGQASAFVARYAPSGALEGVYELPLDSTVALSRRFVAVAPGGDVYFLRNRKGATDVLGVGFRAQKPGVVEIGPPRAQPLLSELAGRKGANAAVRPLSRQQVIQTAQAFATVRWRVNPGAYGGDPDRTCTGFNRVRRPGYLHGKLGEEVQGIPYCWGCMGSLPQIAGSIEAGVKAGNICTRDEPRRDVAGVDCSAFVSAAWGLSTHFTTIAIPSITKPLANPFDLQPGDALNKPGSHVMLFVRFTPDRKAEVIESSTGGCNGKVCRNVYPLGSLLARGYQPVRYRGLADTAQANASGRADLAR